MMCSMSKCGQKGRRTGVLPTRRAVKHHLLLSSKRLGDTSSHFGGHSLAHHNKANCRYVNPVRFSFFSSSFCDLIRAAVFVKRPVTSCQNIAAKDERRHAECAHFSLKEKFFHLRCVEQCLYRDLDLENLDHLHFSQ